MINHNVCSETNTHTAMTQGIPRHSEYRPESELNEETLKQHATEVMSIRGSSGFRRPRTTLFGVKSATAIEAFCSSKFSCHATR